MVSSKVPLVTDLVVPRGRCCRGTGHCCLCVPLSLALAEGSAIPESRRDVVGWLLRVPRLWLAVGLLGLLLSSAVVVARVVPGLWLLRCRRVRLLCPPSVGGCFGGSRLPLWAPLVGVGRLPVQKV